MPGDNEAKRCEFPRVLMPNSTAGGNPRALQLAVGSPRGVAGYRPKVFLNRNFPWPTG